MTTVKQDYIAARMGFIPELSVSTFAPPRASWWVPASSVRFSSSEWLGVSVALPLLLFTMLLSASALQQSLLRTPVPAAGNLFLPAYNSVAVPVAPTTQPIASLNLVFASNFESSFAAALGNIWDKSFNVAGTAFVASVYELGDSSNAAVHNELNVSLAWDAWTTALAQTLYPASP